MAREQRSNGSTEQRRGPAPSPLLRRPVAPSLRRSPRRRGSVEQKLLFGCVAGLLVVLAGGSGYYWWANLLPSFRPERVVLPQPNGYGALVAATTRFQPAREERGEDEFAPRAPLP